ncbi:YceI family protein [Bdellovibrio sp. 22V]|uniref:YceI family protein n=1 Tax=Bdellovibrio TaxID=958 RepID=UPI002542DAC0|nr:YceI family protein [Bdellovibrio sp. 22V]WII71369.1 YceI family protein [Bdellovibrio sp. 22V]
MMKSVLAALVVLFGVHAFAADVYKVDAKASTVAWKGMKKMGSSHNGGIAVKEGQVQVDKKGQITGGLITIDMASITNNDLKDSPDYQKKLIGHLSNEDFFNVTKFPTSSFKLLSVTPKSKDEVLVKGEFTMIGKTNPIEFPAKVTLDKGVMTGEALVKIDRTKWGLKYGSGNFFKELAADKIIADEFELNLKLVAKK